MGMWGGILEGMNQNAAEVISDQQVQMALDREERAIETHKLDNKIKQVSLLGTMKDLTGRDGELTFPGDTSTTSETTKGGNVQNDMQRLTATYQISEDVITTIYKEGGAPAIANLLKISNDLKEKIGTGNFVGNPDFNTLIGSLINSRVTTEGSSTPVDLTKFSTILGEELISELELLGATNVTPGVTSFDPNEVLLIKRISQSDLNSIQDGFASALINQASAELNSLNKVIVAATAPAEVMAWAANRNAEVGRARSDAKATNSDLGGLLQFYGSDYFQKQAARNSSFEPSVDLPSSIYNMTQENPAIEIRSADPSVTASGNLYLDLLDNFNLIKMGQLVRVWDERLGVYMVGPAGGELIKEVE